MVLYFWAFILIEKRRKEPDEKMAGQNDRLFYPIPATR